MMQDKFENAFTEIFPELKDSYEESIKSRFTEFLEAIIMNKEPVIDLKKEYVEEEKSESLASS